MAASCEQPAVLVDYDHPHGTVTGVSIAALMASDVSNTRAVMVVRHPRCAVCGAALTRRDVAGRVRRGGDLYDRRLSWVW
jgi:hypothetical protein